MSDTILLYNCVGFCVARSDDVGNAKASSCGTGDSYELPRFLFFNKVCAVREWQNCTNTTFIMKQSFLKMLLALTVLFSISSTGYSQNEQSKEIDLSTFSSWGLQYAADFDAIDKGMYGFGGHNFGLYKNWGISFFVNSNIGIVDADFSSVKAQIGPNCSYALSEKACLYMPLLVDICRTSYVNLENKVKGKFKWGVELIPSIGFKVGKTTLSAGIFLIWANGSSEISTGAIIGIGFPI